LLAEAGVALEAAARSLDLAAEGRLAETNAVAAAAARRVRERDAALAPPEALEQRLGPRLVLLVALAALLDRIARVSQGPAADGPAAASLAAETSATEGGTSP
jgi:hypothetical protein